MLQDVRNIVAHEYAQHVYATICSSILILSRGIHVSATSKWRLPIGEWLAAARCLLLSTAIKDFKGVSVILVVGPVRLFVWSVTESDLAIPNMPLRTLSDVKTDFLKFLAKLSDHR